MNPQDHRQRAERIERSLDKCTPDDYEMRIEGAMLAGTHWVNYVLHRAGVTQPEDDVLHSYMLTVNELRRLRVADAELLDALTEIEDIRPPYVRGNAPNGRAAGESALALLARIREKAKRYFAKD